MLMDAHHRQLGQSALGDRGRLLAALQRYRDGDNLTVAVIGGSIAAGQGAFDAPAFPYWLKVCGKEGGAGAEQEYGRSGERGAGLRIIWETMGHAVSTTYGTTAQSLQGWSQLRCAQWAAVGRNPWQ